MHTSVTQLCSFLHFQQHSEAVVIFVYLACCVIPAKLGFCILRHIKSGYRSCLTREVKYFAFKIKNKVSLF